MIPLIDYGAIADLRKKMAASQAPAPTQGQPAIQPMPQVPIQAPPPPPLLAPPPPNQMLPVAEGPPVANDLPKMPSALSRLVSGINNVGKPQLDEDTRALLTPKQVKSAESGGGLLGRLAVQALTMGMFTPSIQARGRAEAMLAGKVAAGKVKDEQQSRQDAQTEREGLAAVRAEMPPPPDGNDYAATLSWNRQFIAKLMGRGLIKQAWQMSQYLDTTPPKDTSPIRLSPGERMYDANGNLIGEAPSKTPEPKYETFDGKRQVSYDNGKTWTSLGKAGAEISDPLVQVQAEDGSAIWVPRSQAAGRKAVTTGSRAESQGRIRREDELRNTGDDLTNIDVALAAVKENPSAFGLKNALPTVARQRLPNRDNAKDAGTIGSLEFVIGRLRHDRFGGALTPLEASKAARIFSEPTSPPEVIQEQLNIIRAAVARKKDHLSAVIGSDGSKAGVPSYEEWKAKNGGRP